MNKEKILEWIKVRRAAIVATIGVAIALIWTVKEDARLDARFESGIRVDTTVAEIEFVPAGWLHRKRWYARYKTAEGKVIRARFWPRDEYPRNPGHNKRIKLMYLEDEVEKCRWC